MIELLNSIDNNIFLTLNGYHCAYFDHFMKIATGKLIWVPFYASILYVMTRNLRPRQLACAIAAVALTILIADQLCSSTIRPVVARLRPANLENPYRRSSISLTATGEAPTVSRRAMQPTRLHWPDLSEC